MRRLFRAALLGAASLAGAVGLSSVQARAVARANTVEARSAETSTPTQQTPETAGQHRTQNVFLRPGDIRRCYPGEGIWLGYMRSGSGSCRPCWKVGARGRARVGGR